MQYVEVDECTICQNYTKKGRPNPWKLWVFGKTPPEILALNPVEALICAKALPFMTMFKSSYQQRFFKGHCMMFR